MKLFRRRNYLINKDFQFRYIGRMVFGILAMALVAGFTVYYTTWARIMDEFYNVPRIASQYAPLFASVNRTLVVVILVFLVITAVLSIFISHTIAGPIYRFEKTLLNLMQGDLTQQIGLRKGDEFKNLAVMFNDMIAELRKGVSADRVLIEEVAKISQRLQSSGGKTGQLSVEASQDLRKLLENLNQLQGNLQRFKLGQ